MRNLWRKEGQMSKEEQSKALYGELKGVLTRFGEEFDLSLLDAIGVLEIIKFELIAGNMVPGSPVPPRKDASEDVF